MQIDTYLDKTLSNAVKASINDMAMSEEIDHIPIDTQTNLFPLNAESVIINGQRRVIVNSKRLLRSGSFNELQVLNLDGMLTAYIDDLFCDDPLIQIAMAHNESNLFIATSNCRQPLITSYPLESLDSISDIPTSSWSI